MTWLKCRMEFDAPSLLAKLKITPAPGLVFSTSQAHHYRRRRRRRSLSLSSPSLSSRFRRTDIKFTHFLISVLSIQTQHSFTNPIHSLNDKSIYPF